MNSRHGGLAEYPTLLFPAAKHDPSEATSVTDRSARPGPSLRCLGPIPIIPREAMRADVFGPVLLNLSCDKTGIELLLVLTNTNVVDQLNCTGSFESLQL